MIYPQFIKKDNLIGLPAPSNGMKEEDREKFENAIRQLTKKGLSFIVSKNAFVSHEYVSGSAKVRAEEFSSMWNDKNIKGLISIAGGEFMMEILPYLSDLAGTSPKWFMGFSDNTILTHYLLTHLDISSIYHYNFKYFGQKKWHKSVEESFNCITGRQLSFKSYKKFQNERKQNDLPLAGFNLTHKDVWKIATGEKSVCLKGRAIGGCIDVLLMYLGTKYDKTHEFLEKYKNDGFVYFLESCDLDAREVKRALWQLKENGWFKYVNGFVLGRPLVGETNEDLTYKNAVMSVLRQFNVPVILDADIGHKPPTMPVIMGAMCKVECKDKKAKVEFELR